MVSTNSLRTFSEGTAILSFQIALTAVCHFLLGPALERAASTDSLLGRLHPHLSCGSQITATGFLFGLNIVILFYVVPAWVYMCFDLYYESKAPLSAAEDQLDEWKASKLQHPGFRARLNHASYRRSWRLFCLNNYLVGTPMYIIAYRHLAEWRAGPDYCNAPGAADLLPASPQDALLLLGRLLVTYILTDAVFYSTHRFCHEVPALYKYVHKLHHKWVDTFASAAIACHPVEHVFVNLNTIFLPFMIAGVPYYWGTVWLCAATLNTTTSHSGFKLPVMAHANKAHDAHHHFPLCEFGTNIFCDRILGTQFRDRYDTVTGRIRKTFKTQVDLSEVEKARVE